jgi:hypothetical protein
MAKCCTLELGSWIIEKLITVPTEARKLDNSDDALIEQESVERFIIDRRQA